MRGKLVPWSPQVAAEVIRRIRTGESLARVTKDPQMPSVGAVRLWALEHPRFGAELEAARQASGRRGKARGGFAQAGPGRPVGYTPELARLACDRLAQGCSITQLALQLDLPSGATLFRWMAEHPEFRMLYLEACEARAQLLRDEALEIVDDKAEELARARLRADLRMKQAASCTPRKPGLLEPKARQRSWEDLLDALTKRFPEPDD